MSDAEGLQKHSAVIILRASLTAHLVTLDLLYSLSATTTPVTLGWFTTTSTTSTMHPLPPQQEVSVLRKADAVP